MIETGDGSWWDIHNDLDLARLIIEPTKKAICLMFVRTARSVGKNVALRFVDVDYLDISPNLLRRMMDDADFHLAEIGYKSPNDFDHDWLLTEEQAGPADHVYLRFGDDEFLRVYSTTALAEPL